MPVRQSLLESFSLEDLLKLEISTLEEMGMTMGAARKLRKVLSCCCVLHYAIRVKCAGLTMSCAFGICGPNAVLGRLAD